MEQEAIRFLITEGIIPVKTVYVGNIIA